MEFIIESAPQFASLKVRIDMHWYTRYVMVDSQWLKLAPAEQRNNVLAEVVARHVSDDVYNQMRAYLECHPEITGEL